MYIKFLKAVKYCLYTVKRSTRGLQTLKKIICVLTWKEEYSTDVTITK